MSCTRAKSRIAGLPAVLLLAAAPLAAHGEPGPQASGRWTLPVTGSAPTPPMGWNSWNAFGVGLDEAKVVGSAQVIVDAGLAAAGYRYINIDDGWWRQRRDDGRMQVRINLFPSAAVGGPDQTSLRPLTDRLHAMGLKAGLYSDIGRNACSQAWSPDNPNLPEGTVAQREVGLHGHVAQDIALYFGAWNFDYIKVDACGIAHYGADRPLVKNGTYRALPPLVNEHDLGGSDIGAVRALYADMRDALRRVRPAGDYVLSLCAWGAANGRAWGQDVGTMWRTSNDIDANWSRMLHNFDSVATREFYAGPGHWNDPDMLEVGNGAFDAAHLTEARAHMSLWAIEAAPLIIGTDLTHAPRAILDVLSAPEVIAVDQDPAGNQGVIAYIDMLREIVVKTMATRGQKAVALINRGADPADITLTAEQLKFAAGQSVALRDLWTRRALDGFTGQAHFHLAPHQVLLMMAVGTPMLAKGWYLSEIPAAVHVAEDGIAVPEADPVIHRGADPWNVATTGDGFRPTYGGWGAPRADATPYDQSLFVAGQAFRRGLGVLAGSRLEVKAEGRFTRFAAEAGVDDSTRDRRTPVRFEVWGDGRLIAASPAMRAGDPVVRLSAAIEGVKVVELITRSQGPTGAGVTAAWAEARVE